LIFCIELRALDTELVLDVCTALARYNARTWTCRQDERCLVPPWDLRYRSPSHSDRIVLRDAILLRQANERGRFGACGELAAAYAGFLVARGEPAGIEVEQTGEAAWHVVARLRDRILDPAVLGTA
jgi:hypothetical protein